MIEVWVSACWSGEGSGFCVWWEIQLWGKYRHCVQCRKPSQMQLGLKGVDEQTEPVRQTTIELHCCTHASGLRSPVAVAAAAACRHTPPCPTQQRRQQSTPTPSAPSQPPTAAMQQPPLLAARSPPPRQQQQHRQPMSCLGQSWRVVGPLPPALIVSSVWCVWQQSCSTSPHGICPLT